MMQRIELMKLYEFIHMAYNFKEPPKPQEIDLLYPLFEKYTYKEIYEAALEYGKQMLSAPKPAHLIKIAKEKRRSILQEQAAEAKKEIRYDSCGRRIYKCPYCKDSGYMLVDDDPVYSPSATVCICNNPIKAQELKQNGRVRLKLRSHYRKSDNYYVFDFTKGMFVTEEKYCKPQSKRVNVNKLLFDMVNYTKLPF